RALQGTDLSRPILIKTPTGERQLDERNLPLHIGSAVNSDIRISGPAGAAPIASIGMLDERCFLQTSGVGISINGEAVSGTCWLDNNDVIQARGIEVVCGFSDAEVVFDLSLPAAEAHTLPPELEAAGESGDSEIAPLPRPRQVSGAVNARTHPKALWTVYGALALLLLVALYVFTARSVLLQTEPANASVDISGALFTPQLGERYLLQAGEYTVQAEAPGFFPMQENIFIGDADEQIFELSLREQPGRLIFDFPEGVFAEVHIDGQQYADFPDAGLELPAGNYQYRIVATRYLDFAGQMHVEGRGITQTITPELVPNWSEVTVATEPAGATVSVSGEDMGVTPATVPVAAGEQTLLIQKDGYRMVRRKISVVAGQAQELPLIELKEAEGIVSIMSNPGSAAVTVNGVYKGTTPLDVELDRGKTHAIKVSKPGYAAASQSIFMENRKARSVQFKLQQQQGQVTIVAEPADATLLIDGESVGPASRTITLSAMPHKLEVRKPGYESATAQVTPQPGLPKVVEFRLLTPAEALLAATPDIVSTQDGLTKLILVPPGEFMMGTSRREQGRRANETRRSIRLTQPFYLGIKEVSNAEFRRFRPQHTSGAERFRELAADRHPAVMLSWDDAAGYCNWLSDQEGLAHAYVDKGDGLRLTDSPGPGYRLPTEAEWVWAVRYAGGRGVRKYPWGDQMPPADRSGNYADMAGDGFIDNVLSAYNDGYPVSSPVAKFPPSPVGLYDSGGNAAEWVNDIYVVGSQAGNVVEIDPVGPVEGEYHVIRGSSWRHSSISELRLGYRDFGDKGRLDVGFRVARYTDAVK
ncbi:MAG: PEGA domain-containing protein, partial [Gammaproteobacteria bacterium]